MAGALSLAAGILAVIQVTGQAVTLGYGYLGAVKRAPKDLEELVNELRSLATVLNHLKDYSNTSAGLATLSGLNRQDGPLRVCLEELQNLGRKLTLKKGWRRLIGRLTWPLKEAEIAQFLSRVERHKSLFTFALTADQMGLLKVIEVYVRDTDGAVREIEKHVRGTSLVVQELKSASMAQATWRDKGDFLRVAQKRKEVLQWLYSEPFDRRHLETSHKRQKGTGAWIPHSPEFHAWTNGNSGSSLLWAHGIPGAGKTFISSFVIDYFEGLASVKRYGVAHIYFDYNGQSQQTPILVLASLVKQLVGQIPQLPRGIEDFYDGLVERGKRPTIEQLYTAFLATINYFSRTFIILDALDECDRESQRRELLPLLGRMEKDGVSMFLTSRPHPEDIKEFLLHAAKIEISAKEEDIKLYIEEKIRQSTRARRLVEKGRCKGRIVSELADCAQGMFLLVRFHIEYLCQQTSVNQILAALGEIRGSASGTKKGPLDATYDRAMDTIRGQPESCKNLALNVLSWIVNAKRTLTIAEVQVAVSIGQGRYELSEMDLPDRATLLDVCAGLVAIDENTKTVRLTHYTVQEYLLKHSIIPEDTEFKLMMACITFLSFDSFAQGACMSYRAYLSRIESHPFLDYAARYLVSHLKACDESLTVDAVLEFLNRPGNIHSFEQIRYLQQFDHYTVGDYRSGNYPKGRTPIHVASSLGHCAVVQLLLKQGANVEIPDSKGVTPLCLAVNSGQEAVVQLLIEKEKDSDFTSLSGVGQSPLQWAAFKGSTALVRLLIERGIDPSIPEKHGIFPLSWAVINNKEAMVEILIENGADINAKDMSNVGRTVLLDAASRCYEGIFRLLMEGGANLFDVDSHGNNALGLAALGGNAEMVRLLLEKRLDISTQNQRGETPLLLAAPCGSVEIIQILIEGGAEVSAANSNGATAVDMAAHYGNEAVVQLLFEKGAKSDFSVLVGGMTPLHSCASRSESCCQLLIENGANISTRASNGSTIMHVAANSGKGKVVQLLLERGADISALDNHGRTVLHEAARGGDEKIVRLLIGKGAKISVRDQSGKTALSHAASGGFEDIVRLLVELGAEFSAPDENGSTPLLTAVKCGHEGIARFLLEQGAITSVPDSDGKTEFHWAASEELIHMMIQRGVNFSVRDNYGRTALHLAAYWGNKTAVRLLVEKGADISLLDCNGKTPLLHAAFRGHLAIVEYLVEKGGGAVLFIPDAKGRTSLFYATSNGHLAMVRYLVEKGDDLSVTDTSGTTLLHEAARHGHEQVAEFLLKEGAEISALDHNGRTALYQAASGGSRALVQQLIELGGDFAAPDDSGVTPLYNAAQCGNIEVVQLLLERGASLSVRGVDGLTSLHGAASRGNLAVVMLLIDYGANLSIKDGSGQTALHWAANGGHEPVVRLLIKRGADISVQDENGNTALHLASQEGRILVVRLLLERGADNSITNCNLETPLHCAARAPGFRDTNPYYWVYHYEIVIKFLLKAGADVLSLDRSLKTPADHMRECGQDIGRIEEILKCLEVHSARR